MPPAGQQQTTKQTTPNAQTKMAIRPCRVTTDREANNTQSNAQTKMAFCHYRVTTVREASNVQCADQNGVLPLPSNNRLQTKMLFRPPPNNKRFHTKTCRFPFELFSKIAYIIFVERQQWRKNNEEEDFSGNISYSFNGSPCFFKMVPQELSCQ